MPRAAIASILTFVGILAATAAARAQIIYEPVRYQYGGQNPYYYGGSDPAVFADAESLSHENGWGRTNGSDFHSGNVETFREVASEPTRVYTDEIPYINAAVLGYTASDARNSAYANVPRYFAKRSLLAAAVPVADETGHVSLVVPAQARPVLRIFARRANSRSAASPTTLPAPILIIPNPRPRPGSTPTPSGKIIASAQ